MNRERLRKYKDIKAELVQIEHQLISPEVQNHDELQAFYRAKARQLADEQLRIERAIDDLPPVMRRALRHHYIEGLIWEEVCVRMSYSWRHIHRIHRDALDILEEE